LKGEAAEKAVPAKPEARKAVAPKAPGTGKPAPKAAGAGKAYDAQKVVKTGSWDDLMED